LTDVRPFIFLVFATLTGCTALNRPLVFNIRSADVITASAEPLDRSRLSVNRDAPDFNAQLHIVLGEEGAQRFLRFEQAHAGKTYELQVNGVVLNPAVSAFTQATGAREMMWFTRSMEEAQRFAASLNKK